MLRLLTIPISHYCEKARWALDRAGLPYREERHVQAIHRWYAWRAGRKLTVPVLVTPDRVLTESTDILEFCDERGSAPTPLFPVDPARRAEVDSLVRDFDDDLGPQGRLWMYFHIEGHPELLGQYNNQGVPRWEDRAMRWGFPVFRMIINRVLTVTPETAAEAEKRVDATFERVGERLSNGRRYLTGDDFTAADLTFVALSAAVLLPPEGYGARLPQPEVLPPAMAERVVAWRATPAGEFALRVFAEKAGASPVGSS